MKNSANRMDQMWFKSSQYIKLKDSPASIADNAEKKYRLFSPLVQLSRTKRGNRWKLSRGIFIQKGSEGEQALRINITTLLKKVIYGISFLVFAIGYFFKDPGGGGQYNGGQA